MTRFGKQGWTPERLGSQAGKTFVITGTTTGCGFEAAKLLLSKGARVVMLNRSEGRAQERIAELKGELGPDIDVRNIRLDLADLSSVRAGAEDVLAAAPQIDGLICNAAVANLEHRSETVDGLEMQIGINHYGHFLLVTLLRERIEASKGRIVVVSSMGYRMGDRAVRLDDLQFETEYEAFRTYTHSKRVQTMCAFEMQRRLLEAGSDASVYVCHPGAALTSLIDDTAPWGLRTAAKVMTALRMGQSAARGSWPEVLCATEDDLRPKTWYGPTGMGNVMGAVDERELLDFVFDPALVEPLWNDALERTGATWEA